MGSVFSVYMELNFGKAQTWKTHFIQTNSVQKSIAHSVKGEPQSTRCSPELEKVKVCVLSCHVTLQSQSEFCPHLELCQSLSVVGLLAMTICSVQKQDIFFCLVSFSFFNHTLNCTIWTLVSIQTDGFGKKWSFLAWQRFSENCRSFTVEHTEHLILAGSNF